MPDFRQLGPEQHARFVARLWQDLSAGDGYLGADYVAQRIADLDRTSGDIDTLQGRIAAIRSWAYIAQRPDWVLARDEMAARARAVEARLSDALHARLTERFVNRRTTVLMRKLGSDAGLLPVRLDEEGSVFVDDEQIGTLAGFQFRVDHQAPHADHKLLLAAADRHLPRLLGDRLRAVLAELGEDCEAVTLADDNQLRWRGEPIARLEPGRDLLRPRVVLDRSLDLLPGVDRDALAAALERCLEERLSRLLAPLQRLAAASLAFGSGAALRALALRLVEAGGALARDLADLENLSPEQRRELRRLGVSVGALDVFVPAVLRPAPLGLWVQLSRLAGRDPPPVAAPMPPVRNERGRAAGYRRAGQQWLRVDLAEKLLRLAHGARAGARGRRFGLSPDVALSMGLTTASYAALLRAAGFRPLVPRPIGEDAAGPPAPLLWEWRPVRPRRVTSAREQALPAESRPGNAFAALAEWRAG